MHYLTKMYSKNTVFIWNLLAMLNTVLFYFFPSCYAYITVLYFPQIFLFSYLNQNRSCHNKSQTPVFKIQKLLIYKSYKWRHRNF